MASFLDQLFNPGAGGAYGLLPPPGDPAWELIRQRLAEQQGATAPQLRYNPDAYVSPVDLRGGGGLAIAPGPQRNVRRDQFGRGAEAQSLYDVAPSGFGFAPPVSQQAAIPLPSNPQAPPALEDRAPPMMLENIPPAAQPTAGAGLPPVDRRQPQTPPQYRQSPVGPSSLPQPQYQPPGSPDFGDRLTAGFANILAKPFSPYGLFEGAQGFATGMRTDPVGAYQQMAAQTYKALRGAGVPDAQAQLAATNPAAQKLVIEQMFGQGKPSGTYKLGDTEIPYSLGPGGQANLILPGGGQGSIGDLVNLSQTISAQGAQRKASATAQGEVQGKAAANLPATLQTSDQALAAIDALQNHPGKAYAVGKLGLIPAIPGTAQGDFVTQLKQAQGQTFLAAYQSLRGGGQISNVEGEKAQEAIGRLSRAQTPQAFDQALNELRGIIQAGKQNAIRIARGDTQAYTSPQPVAGWTTLPNGVRIREVK